jgi:uncharacterized membrane protein YecN with MAPEG domain
MTALPVTALYAGLLGLWVMWLAWEVGNRRRRHKVALGDGGVAELNAAIRAHGNACETVPLALILMALAEGMGAPGWGLHLAGLALVAGRVLHGLHFVLGRRDLSFRFVGMTLTVVPIILLALGLAGHALVALMGTQ